MWGNGCIEPFRMVGSCPHVSVVVVLASPHFPSLRYIYAAWSPNDVLISVWNDWFMTSCCNGCGVGLPWFPVFPKHALLLSQMMFSYSSFYDDVLYTTDVQIRAQYFSQMKTMGRAETFESWLSEKGVNSKWNTKKITLSWLIGSRLS